MMADRYLRDQEIGIMADRLDSERLRGFCDRQTDRRIFAILESLSRLKTHVIDRTLASNYF